PSIPRVSVYIHKFNYSHDLIFETGRFVLHLLRDDQFELIHRLGFASGRTRDKLAGLPHRSGTLGLPVLDDCYAHFECRVANVMDTGSSTCFLGDVLDVGYGSAGQAAAIGEQHGDLRTESLAVRARAARSDREHVDRVALREIADQHLRPGVELVGDDVDITIAVQVECDRSTRATRAHHGQVARRI